MVFNHIILATKELTVQILATGYDILCLTHPVILRCESSISFTHGSIFVLYSIEENVMFKYGGGMIHMYWVYLCYMCCDWLYAEFFKNLF